MGLLNKFFNQTRKPEGFLGRVMLSGMNGGGHAKLANFGMGILPKEGIKQIAELGCGGGRNIDSLLNKYDGSFVTAVDYSEESVKKAEKFNKKNALRCEIKQGDVRTLDLPKSQFNLATAFETVYFWPEIESCFRNVFEILKEEGHFLIVNESDGKDETGKKFESIIDGMKVYTAEELTDALKKAGFKDVKVTHHEKNPWIAVLATK
ncbi:MAG: class I SAM-dependent methyltransferase [Clostridia bacterium]|nr:class I SAM-dependent methyltransferase [Clostridia bacterium]